MQSEPVEPTLARRRRVERVFFELGWENVEDIDEWDGADLEALRRVLGEERFQALLDELGDEAEPEP